MVLNLKKFFLGQVVLLVCLIKINIPALICLIQNGKRLFSERRERLFSYERRGVQ